MIFTGVGMVLAILSMIIAAIVEIQRKDIMLQGHYLQQNLSKEVFNASDLSILAQIPQFALIGASEVFAGNTGMEHCGIFVIFIRRALSSYCWIFPKLP